MDGHGRQYAHAALSESHRGCATPPALTLESVTVRAVQVPLHRPIVAKVGTFADWPLLLGGARGKVRAYNTNGLWLVAQQRIETEAAALVAEGGFEAIKLRLGRRDWASPLLTEPPTVKEGFVTVPGRPGSGIDWNEDAVKRFAL